MQLWSRRNSKQINCAANQALLQHRDQPPGQHHLIDTHFLKVDLKPGQPPDYMEFDVDFAQVFPLEELKTIFDLIPEGDARCEESLKEAKRAREASGQPLAGTMWIVVEAYTAHIVTALTVGQEVIDYHRLVAHNPAWEETLKNTIAGKDDTVYGVAGGRAIVTVRAPEES